LFSSPGERHRGILRCGPLVLPCAIGRSGVTHLKREGDGATPAGRHRLLSLYARPDRVLGPRSGVPGRPVRREDGWCEDPRDGRYNRPIRLPADSSHDRLWREDHLYDIVGVLDWNITPRIRGRGSAIFLHLCRPGFGPTAGCIALRGGDLQRLLVAGGARPVFLVAAKPCKRPRES
jgi:L,D-peptidoglycan transpeptidase YkuD (ErfK/YbiS/YcfS/YnhG family)